MINEQQLSDIQRAAEQLGTAPVYIDDTPAGMPILTLRGKARRMASQYGLRALFVDYLQLMTSPGAENRRVEVDGISRGLKALARELNIPVVALAQLNREVEQRQGRPRINELRESGSLEQDADVVMLLHREAIYHRDDPGWAREHPDEVSSAEVIVAKQRSGPTGLVRLHFSGHTTTFGNLAIRNPTEQTMWYGQD